jgi:zinc/manganese transport system substrate-binding protein
VVANGLGLEEGLQDALAEAEANGVQVFEATDHIDVRTLGDSEQDGVGAQDPHFWMDPVAMIAVVDALAPAIAELGVDIGDRQADLVTRLAALDEEVRATLDAIPVESRKLVTGHESMGYFADRYGFELVGAIIPGLTSQGEVSARALAELADRIRSAGVGVVFTEVGTPQSVAESIAAETGATVVQLPGHTLPADGSYFTFIRGIAEAIAGALT